MRELWRNILGCVFLITVATSFATAVWGQVVGASISGTVRDNSGAGIPEASVTIRNLETGTHRVLVSDGVGRYAAPSVAIGHYDVTARKEGFESQVKTPLDLAVGQRLVLDFNLPVGQVRESVTVVELSSPVAVTTQQNSGLVNERQVKDLPLKRSQL